MANLLYRALARFFTGDQFTGTPPDWPSHPIWNKVHRWLEKAAACCRRFSDGKVRRLAAMELQADEIRTIVGSKEKPVWVFVVIDVWSRFWPSTVVGQRSYQNTLALFRDLSSRMNLQQLPLIVTDGLSYYGKVVGGVFGPACLIVFESERFEKENEIVVADFLSLQNLWNCGNPESG
jgi:hypothetical protein